MIPRKAVEPISNGERQGTAPAISLPKGGGAVRGIGEKFAANPVTGTGTFSVPVATSAGRSGFGPQLSLSYDSGAGNGPFGLGWKLSLPAISRKTEKGLPKYQDEDESDVFILSGTEDLVPEFVQTSFGKWKGESLTCRTVAGHTYWIRRYRPRIEGLFARIERWTNTCDRSDVFWRTISKDNITTWYGKTPESRIADPTEPANIFSWLICQSYDDKGNVIDYCYKAEDSSGIQVNGAFNPHERNRSPQTRSAQRYLKSIRYGNRVPYFPELKDDAAWPEPTPENATAGSDGWLFEVVFDYGEHDVDAATTLESLPWPARCDPFSTYRSGFEVRTYRTCRRVLMFHHFPGETGVERNCLVHSTDFTYSNPPRPTHAQVPVYTKLLQVTQTAFRRCDGGYESRSLPPLEFEYTEPLVQETIEEIDGASAENLPHGVDGRAYRWADLHGEGLTGILAEQSGAWHYKRNISPTFGTVRDGRGKSAARFAPLETVALKPNHAMDGGLELLDLAGDGLPDAAVMGGPTPGFYEHDESRGWQPFRPFISWPNLDFGDANVRLVDLDGDGHADVLITKEDALVWHPSLLEAGFGSARRIALCEDEEAGPRVVFAEATQTIFLADMSGDGLADIVRIRNGEVCYWPNMGYGRFGAKVTMDHPPYFDQPDLFDSQRVRLADIDGSGTSDIIYLHRDGVRLYFNQSGNGWSRAKLLRVFPQIDDLASVMAVDLLGNGTACLVWSSALPVDASRPMRYVNLMGGQKPHLLCRVVNNLGAETRVDYAPSTRFYLQDIQNGRPWITRLPFPVHVVEKVTTYDHIGRNCFMSCYAYHHGHYDGVEREFRGFGMVEQWDSETFATIAGEFSAAANRADVSHVPPIHTKTWFHTGVYLDRDRVSAYFSGLLNGCDRGEYFREPGLSAVEARDLLLPDTVLPEGLTLEEQREACRALKGSILRQEVYADDAGPDASASLRQRSRTPYTVTEQNFAIRMLQPRGGNRHAVFLVHSAQSLSHHYERNPTDPRTQHTLTLEVDSFGNILKQAAVGYGRRTHILATDGHGYWRLTPNPGLAELTSCDRAKQTTPLLTYTENRFTNSVEKSDVHRSPLLCETLTHEMTGYVPTGPAGRYQPEDFVETDPADVGRLRHKHIAPDVPYEALAQGNQRRRPIELVRTLYRRDDLQGILPLGEVQSLALPGETCKLAFTASLLRRIYQRPREGELDESLLPDPETVLGGASGECCGYLSGRTLKADGRFPATDADDDWWIPSGRVFYTADPAQGANDELAEARGHFFLPRLYRDPFGQENQVEFDAHDLLIAETRDPLGSRVTVEVHDYRVLQPRRISDPNRNRTEVAFDVLGMVVGTAVMGKSSPAAVEGDSLAGFVSELTQSERDSFLGAADPHASAPGLLQDATTRIVYDLDRFVRTRAAHPDDPSRWLPACAATLARETHVSGPHHVGDTRIQLSFSYSDGFGREIQKKVQAESGPLTAGGFVHNLRWVGSGWTIFNNKGQPVRQYEPFFSTAHGFEFGIAVGVSPVLFYDPAGRVVATLHPNHAYEKVVFDPWQRTTFDVNDTCAPHGTQTGDPRTDPDIRGYVAEYFKVQPAGWRSWLEQRIAGGMGPRERQAAEKAAVHADTPTTAHFDALGRPFLTVARNRVACPGHDLDGLEETITSRAELDIEGNEREVRDGLRQADDPLGRVVMRYAYDMLGNRIHQVSMEAGARWMLNDVTGKPIRAWDSRGHTFTTSYDALRRPLSQTVRGTTALSDPHTLDRDVVVDRVEYGETVPDAQALNLRTRVFRHFDSAGVATNARLDDDGRPLEAYDFKGNLLCAARQLVSGYKSVPDWSRNPPLEPEVFQSRTRYDALNRPVQSIAPHSSLGRGGFNVLQPVFNEANMLERVDVWLDRSEEPAARLDPDVEPPSSVGVANIDYDAKGQRLRIEYKNGVRTSYEYDPLTFRLLSLRTNRETSRRVDSPAGDEHAATVPSPGTCDLQGLHYTYDPAGNITRIDDEAQQTVYFRNRRVEPSCDYVYDALYRLIQATGREHIGQCCGPHPHSSDDSDRVRLPHPGDGHAMATYTERYVYDVVGNILQMQHRGGDPASAGWTRAYDYLEPSQIERGDEGAPPRHSNRLSSTRLSPEDPHPCTESYEHDAHGNMLRMPHLGVGSPGQNMHWNCKDQLRRVDLGGGGTAYYLYDASGQRVRKVWEKSPGLVEERIYLGGFEIHRRHTGPIGPDSATLERQTLHVMDNAQRIALVEKRTLDREGDDPAPRQLIRYQFGNHLGSSSLELDEAARVISYEEYAPYGSTTYQAVRHEIETPKRYRYTGKERDEESGLYYHGARYYAPWLARWTAADPIGLIDGPNLYRYSRNCPVVLNDPDGTEPPDPRQYPNYEEFSAAAPSPYSNEYLQEVWQQAHPTVPAPYPENYLDQDVLSPQDPSHALAALEHSERLRPPTQSSQQSEGRMRLSGIRTPEPGTTLTPRAYYSNPIAAEAAARGFIHWAELVEAGHGCSACHVTHNINRIPTDAEFNLNRYNTVSYSMFAARAVTEFALSVGQARVMWGAGRGGPPSPPGGGGGGGASGGRRNYYIPRDADGNPIPLQTQRVNNTDIPLPDPNARGAHTVLGGRVGSDGVVYRQSATFPSNQAWPAANGQNVPWSRVDWHNHSRTDHAIPHQHPYVYDSSRGGWTEGRRLPFSSSSGD